MISANSLTIAQYTLSVWLLVIFEITAKFDQFCCYWGAEVEYCKRFPTKKQECPPEMAGERLFIANKSALYRYGDILEYIETGNT